MFALGVMSMSAALSTDLYLPSFPALAKAFDVGPTTVQLTLTAFMAGLALGQLLVGPLSDALGRRPILLVGLMLFALCSFAAVISPSIEALIAVRAMQGLAAASAAALARAIISDLAAPGETARAFSLLFIMIALGPAIASPLGAVLTEFGGWRAPMLGLGAIATGMLALAVLRVPESLPADRRLPFRPGTLVRNLWRLVRAPTFAGYAVAFGSGYAAMMVYIGSSPFIALDIFGLTPSGYALTFVATSLSFMAGAWVGGGLAARIGGHATLLTAQSVQLGAAVIATILAVAGVLGLAGYLLLVALLCAASGMLMPTASGRAIAQATGIAGAGSALVGFSQFAFGAWSAPLGGLFGMATAVPATAAMAGLALVSIAGSSLAGCAIRRTRRPR